MTSKRKRYSAQFKAKVVLEAPRGELTIADRRRLRQRLNGQVLAATPWHRRRPNASIHLAPHCKKSGCHHPLPAPSTQFPAPSTQFSETLV
jgi:hypothetical protein